MRNINHYLNNTLPALGYGGRIRVRPLKGDGSDRRIFRVFCGRKSVILAHYPQGSNGSPSENDSFCLIDRHLRDRGLPVPEIFDYNPGGGQFLLEDFGDLPLTEAVKNKDNAFILDKYSEIIKLLIRIQVEGAQGFRTDWCYDTPVYDGAFSRERETEYFSREFAQGFLKRPLAERPRSELLEIVGRVDEERIRLFLYRDFQSRNIMVGERGLGLIDFQAGRLGPPQYDLASLLIDPYVRLAPELQDDLRDYYLQLLSEHLEINRTIFQENYYVIGFQRNLQILGAFSFLSRVKGKKYFEQYVPPALENLKRWIKFPMFKGYRHLRRWLGEI